MVLPSIHLLSFAICTLDVSQFIFLRQSLSKDGSDLKIGSFLHSISMEPSKRLKVESKERPNVWLDKEWAKEAEFFEAETAVETFPRLCAALGVPINDEMSDALRNFARHMKSHYRANPYHNWLHAVDVTKNAFFLAKHIPDLTPTNRLALLLSALAHDVDHLGLPNSALCDDEHEWALRYNNQSPLENRALALLFSTLATAGCQAFRRNLGEKEYARFRKTCIDLVLVTDVTAKDRSKALEERWKTVCGQRQKDGVNWKTSDLYQLTLMQILIRAADIGVTASSFSKFTG